MNSPGVSSSRADLAGRLSNVMQASRAIRSEVALAICESRETRLASRQLRMHCLQTSSESAAQRRRRAPNKERGKRIAHAIAQVLSRQGYSVFVTAPSQDTASLQ
jgi:hypothetical protein